MLSAVAYLIGNPLGRKIAGGLLIAAMIGLAILRVYRAGAASERAKHNQASLENLRTRMRTDDEIASMSPADRRKRLAEWVSD